MTQEHATPEAPQVTVRGEGRLDVDPELARIWLTVSARGTDRAATLADLTRRNAQVIDLVKAAGEAVEKLETGRLTIAPELGRRGRGERVHAYTGRVRVTAELTDFTALGELVTRLADLEMTGVDGPWWALRPDSPAYAEARRLAVTEAVRRARAYAEALGTSLSSLLELSDAGLAGPAMPRTAGFAGAPVAFAAEGADEAPPLDLEPQRQTVTAEVVARFTMRPPAL
ncbi:MULTISPECIES: SIMPL domain-containing protein [Streptomyces]|uniref:Periplasmic immunogenic protein n=1 Tax=Streptomyces viridochromogenes TaxID=1938 RepID=A0A0L8J541_STRVR|nr:MULTISPECIES: SIMPL domain-containing protein [Streptomyces]KOG08584.1 periplasmic immunogenic protein [Streptomyces viridochromogenes]